MHRAILLYLSLCTKYDKYSTVFEYFLNMKTYQL